jgi:hypothetical protein
MVVGFTTAYAISVYYHFFLSSRKIISIKDIKMYNFKIKDGNVQMREKGYGV